MSAMTESFDMPMADFSGDFDIQMQPSTSDPWYQELETKMEEDGPTLFKIEDSPSKNMAISHEKADGGIEVDMEPFIEEYNAEYEMVDDEHFHAPAEVHDVELHDADVSIELEEAPASSVPPLPLPHSVSSLSEGFALEPIAMENAPLQPSASQPEMLNSQSDNSAIALDDTTNAVVPDHVHFPQEVTSTGPVTETHIAEGSDMPEHLPEHLPATAIPNTFSGEVAVTSHDAQTPLQPEQEGSAPILPAEPAPEQASAPQETVAETHVPSESAGLDEPHVDNEAEAPMAPSGVGLADQQWNNESDFPDVPHVGGEGDHQEVVNEIAASTGDPHEISEGVYIDPPPPILLSLGSGDVYDFCLFNNGEHILYENQADEHILLANFPTLYYESLSYIFEALRCEEKVHQTFNLVEGELILEAPDLQLTVSEDNIHTRDVTLHDLNILHDVSGLDGLLRIKLSQSLPRFIYRYQRLQEEVNRLHLDVATDEESAAEAGNGDVSVSTDNQGQDSFTTEQQSAEDPNAGSESHHEDQGNSQPNDDQDAYADGSYAVGDETIYEDAHDDLGEENNDDENNPADDQTSSVALPHFNETSSVSNGPDHSTTDEHVNSEDKLEHSHNADLESLHPSGEVDGASGDENQADENADPGYDNEGDDIDGGGTEQSNFDGVGHHVVDGEYEAGVDDAEDNCSADDTYPEDDGKDEVIGATNNGGNVSGNNIDEDIQHSAEDYDSQDFEGLPQPHDDPTYDQEETADVQDEYNEEEHVEQVQNDGESTTANTTTNDSEQTHLEPAVLIEGDLQHHDDGQTESETLDDLEGVASGSNQSYHLSSKNAQDLAEDSHLDPPVHAYDLEGDIWEGELNDDGEFGDEAWDEDGAENDNENAQSHSNESSVTLSSKASKRSFNEFELDDEGYEDESGIYGTPPSSPGAKRTRTH